MGMLSEAIANGIEEDIQKEITKIKSEQDEVSMGDGTYFKGYLDGLKKAMEFTYKY